MIDATVKGAGRLTTFRRCQSLRERLNTGAGKRPFGSLAISRPQGSYREELAAWSLVV